VQPGATCPDLIMRIEDYRPGGTIPSWGAQAHQRQLHVSDSGAGRHHGSGRGVRIHRAADHLARLHTAAKAQWRQQCQSRG
jgi:hypothetical protein